MKLNRFFILAYLSSVPLWASEADRNQTLNPEFISESYQPVRDKLLKSAIAVNGMNSFQFEDISEGIKLKTKYEIDAGKVHNQKSSGRCWIFAGEKLLSAEFRKTLGKDFSFSQNYFAFWDKMERVNYILEKLFEMDQANPADIQVQELLKLSGDGGEWEFFKNIVSKYGVVPDYVMPETNFSGNTAGFNKILKTLIRHGYGQILQIKSRSLNDHDAGTEFEQVKKEILKSTYNILSSYLGTPPQAHKKHPGKFYWKHTGPSLSEQKDSNAEQKSGAPQDEYVTLISPQELLKRSGVNVDDYIHVAHLPYLTSGQSGLQPGSQVIAKNVGNIIEGEDLKAILLDMPEIKESVRNSIKSGVGVEIGCDMKHLDVKRSLLSLSSDAYKDIFQISSGYVEKGIRLRTGEDKIAHGMLIVGCDDPTKCLVKDALPEDDTPESFGPLWKVHNSWGDQASAIFLTDPWFDEYAQSFVIRKDFLPESLFTSPLKTFEIPSTDPFAQVTS